MQINSHYPRARARTGEESLHQGFIANRPDKEKSGAGH